MLLHPHLQSLLQLPSPFIEEQYTYRIHAACPQCSSHLWVAPQSLTCESNTCNWEAQWDPVSNSLAILYWLVEEGESYYLQVEVNYNSLSTTISGAVNYHLSNTILTPPEVQELLLWM